MKKIISICTIILGAFVISAAPVELVKDGQALAEIVLANNANESAKLAAKDLQDYIKKMSGAELKIVNAPTPDIKNKVYVGANEFTDKIGFKPANFNNSGFEIVAKNNYVILSGYDRLSKISPFNKKENIKEWQDFCGAKLGYPKNGAGRYNNILKIYANDDTGTWYAVSALLEQLGVRFYAPYENGTVIPEMKSISVPEQNLKSEAAFARREWCYYRAMETDEDGVAWLKRLKSGSYTPIIFGHTTYDVYSSKEQQELHPEYLACDKNGTPYKGSPPGSGIPRYSNEGFRNTSILLMNKLFQAHPDLTAICMGQPDGGVSIDYRDLDLYGTKDESIEQRISNCLWDYTVFLAKEMKKSHPDKTVIHFAYGKGARMIPTNIKSDDPDNIAIALMNPTQNRVLKSEDNAILDERKKWLAVLKGKHKTPIWAHYRYYSKPSSPRVPVFFSKSLQEQMQEMSSYAEGQFMELQPLWQARALKVSPETMKIGEPAIMHLMIYWQNKLLWDPNLDRNAVFDEYYKLYFGPAAAEMKKFHELSEEIWSRQEARSITQSTGFLKEADVEKYFEILASAREKAGKDSVYDKRIVAMEEAYQPLRKLFPNLKRQGPDFRSYPVPNNINIDGDVTKYKRGWVTLTNKATGEKVKKNIQTSVSVSMSEDKKNLYLAAICYEPKMDKIKAETKLNDSISIFNDDALELYINTPEKSYFKIAVNSNGAVWDESTDVSIIDRDTLSILWNPGIKVVAKKYDDRWTVEMAIPTKDFGLTGPSKQFPWGIQIGRTRLAGESDEVYALGTGPGPYSNSVQWGNLWMR